MKTSDYFTYLNEGLGLDHIILQTSHPQICFYCVAASGELQFAENELLQKMIAAMKIPSGRFRIAIVKEIPTSFSEAINVVLADHAAKTEMGIWSVHDSSQVILTYGLQSLLQDAHLKKPCWSHLQSVLERI
ncbi:MAG: hypothetical protein H6623_05765 [Bdellovibrionaceae bacterium]|nr:hypothetical protein [Pseudobdellovibrionaceae bacterium]